jgi:hypothetical protein
MRKLWEHASIAHFCSTFATQLKLRRFTVDELEHGFADPRGNLLLEELHYRLLPERPESFGDGVAWLRQLKITLYQHIDRFCDRYPQAIDPKLLITGSNKRRPAKVFRRGKRSSRRLRGGEGEDAEMSEESEESEDGEDNGTTEDDENAKMEDVTAVAEQTMDLDDDDLGIPNTERDERNPLHAKTYYEIPVETRVTILKALCDWKLQTTEDDASKQERDHLIGSRLEPEDLRIEPIEQDKTGASYWHFEKIGYRIYKETPVEDEHSPRSRRGKSAVSSPIPEWSVAAGSINELKTLVKKIGKQAGETQLKKALQNILTDWETNHESSERARAKAKQIQLMMLNVKRSSRVQLLDQRREAADTMSTEEKRIAEIRHEAEEHRKEQERKAGEVAAAAHQTDLEEEWQEEVSAVVEPAKPVKEDPDARRKREKREKTRARAAAEKLEQDAREEEAERKKQKTERANQQLREERQRRRELGESAPPPPRELQEQLDVVGKGDWVEVLYDEDQQWYVAEVLTSSVVRVKVQYPESADWATWDEIIPRTELRLGKVRIATPELVESAKEAQQVIMEQAAAAELERLQEEAEAARLEAEAKEARLAKQREQARKRAGAKKAAAFFASSKKIKEEEAAAATTKEVEQAAAKKEQQRLQRYVHTICWSAAAPRHSHATSAYCNSPWALP